MGRLRTRPTVIGTLLLAALTLSGLLAEGHSHEFAGSDHSDLPAFAAGHQLPDRSAHIEAATQIEVSSCLACLHRQQRADQAALASFGTPEPTPTSLASRPRRSAKSGAHELPASRAPPPA